MNLQQRIDAFEQLGKFLQLFQAENVTNFNNDCEKSAYELLWVQIHQSTHHNGWFTKENVLFALQSWAEVLTRENLTQWTSAYDFSQTIPKTVGIVTAGNIPLVGMHDFISVLISGHNIVIKQSSNDQKLLPVIARFLICLQPEFEEKIRFTEGKLAGFDAVIATGSNNTARYFEAYFDKYPHIIRRNRNAVAILTGNESAEQLAALGEDIFRYFGLGCRSISKIFIPRNYDLDLIFKAIFHQQEIINHHKYKNNYDYNKAIYLMGNVPLVENGFLLLKEDAGYASPIAVLFYEFYDSPENLTKRLEVEKEQIQCIVSENLTDDSISFGETQKPQLWDYADGVDTLDFLLKL